MELRTRFLKSAFKAKDYPFLYGFQDIAVLGRSNSGKSSLINAFSQSDLAKTSKRPGKTRFLNFYQTKKKFFLVDVPGYGFSKRSQSEMKSWKKMMEEYLFYREALKGIVLIMDVRRDFEKEEKMILEIARRRSCFFCLLLNKIDQLNMKELNERKKYFNSLNLNHFFVSCLKKQGFSKVNEFILQNLK